jgi:hypothetical protein
MNVCVYIVLKCIPTGLTETNVYICCFEMYTDRCNLSECEYPLLCNVYLEISLNAYEYPLFCNVYLEVSLNAYEYPLFCNVYLEVSLNAYE